MSKYRVDGELVTICDDCNLEIHNDGSTGPRTRSDIDHVDGRERECLTVSSHCAACAKAKFGENPIIMMGKFETRIIEWGPHTSHPGRIDRQLVITNPVVANRSIDASMIEIRTPRHPQAIVINLGDCNLTKSE